MEQSSNKNSPKIVVNKSIELPLDDIVVVPTDEWLAEKDDEVDVLFIGDAAVGSLGNFSCICGRAKSRKTFFISAMAAAALGAEKCCNVRAKLPENKSIVIYVDTEQSKKHYRKTLNRIKKMSNFIYEKIVLVPIREYSTEDRIKIIEQILKCYEKQVGLVIIDGIRDLINDINSSSDANKLITHLLQWTTNYNIHIITVLHLNKSDDNARGHIGTEVINKAQSIISIEKDKENRDKSIVVPKYLREKEFETFAFRINENGLPELDGEYDPNATTPAKSDFYAWGEEVHRAALTET
ncbi:MAG: AAA family ATPase, partial [Bacteroidales bacterium]|nr:AAA family ATPase [Bacteroidales bacterium]